jgi:hypothetical protein
VSDPVYAADPRPRPDSDFVAGALRQLVAGNRGRLLDARRTPVTVVAVAAERGAFAVRIEAFEDAGAEWDLWLGEVERFQFERDAQIAGDGELAALERSRERFDRLLVIEPEPGARAAALERVRERREVVRAWLERRGGPPARDFAQLAATRNGDPALFELAEELLGEHGVLELERGFSANFVTNPRSGELVKGHAIVLAELGLCPYHGQVARDPELFAGARTRARRAEHLLWRLAFTRELIGALGGGDAMLFRAAASGGVLSVPRPGSFVSATFSRAVADSHFDGGQSTRAAVLWRQAVPLERVLMTFAETRAMNDRYREAEAVLIGDPANAAF